MATPVEPEAVSQGRPQARLQIIRDGLHRATSLVQRLPELPSLFPFRLGEGQRDWALPYAFDDRIVSLGAYAAEELFDLIAQRRQGEGTPAPRHGLRRGLKPWAIRLAASAAEMDPQLDAALIETWCDKSAGALGDELFGACGRALETELLAEGNAPYGMLFALAAPALVETFKEKLKARSLKGMPYERLEKALGFALFALVELSAQRAIREVERRPSARDPRPAFERVRLCLNPLAYCSIRSRALQNPVNPWWLPDALSESGGPRRPEELLSRSIDSTLQQALQQLLPDPSTRARYATAGRQARLRYEILRVLWEYDRGTEEPWRELRQALAQEEALAELQRNSRPTLQRLTQAGASAKALTPLQQLLGSAGGDLDDLQAALVGELAFAMDRLIADHMDRLARGLRDVRAEGDVRQLIQTYEQGRLYRLSADQRPLLKVAERQVSGHLFVDLKGFTQRTVRAKEIVVADFLKREFYEPILKAAGALCVHGGEEVKLLNLVGDAAAFAGEVPTLVRLAGEIRKLCEAYQKRLASFDSSAAASDEERVRRELQGKLAALEAPVVSEVAALEATIARRQALSLDERERELTRLLHLRSAELAQAHHRVREQLAAAPPAEHAALEAEMVRLSSAQEVLAASSRVALEQLPAGPPQTRADALLELLTAREHARLVELDRRLRQLREQASREAAQRRRLQQIGSGLEAGVFISYGAAPEEIRIQDAVFGEVRVSIAEKLNEAARGTGRSGKVAEEAAEGLRAAIARTGNANLRDPFKVHVGGASSGEVASEIFNVGEAISGGALHVFLQRSGTTRFHFERVVRRAELNPELTEQLALPERFKLIVSFEHDGHVGTALLFRPAGFVLFRGFEEGDGCDVYEILGGEHRLAKLLAQHHLQRWSEEARANPKLLVTGLPAHQP